MFLINFNPSSNYKRPNLGLLEDLSLGYLILNELARGSLSLAHILRIFRKYAERVLGSFRKSDFCCIVALLMIIRRTWHDFQDVVPMNSSRDKLIIFQMVFTVAPALFGWVARRCFGKSQRAGDTLIRVICPSGVFLDGVYAEIVSHLLLQRIVQSCILYWTTDCILLIFAEGGCASICLFSVVFKFLFESHFFEFYLWEDGGVFETPIEVLLTLAAQSGRFVGTRFRIRIYTLEWRFQTKAGLNTLISIRKKSFHFRWHIFLRVLRIQKYFGANLLHLSCLQVWAVFVAARDLTKINIKMCLLVMRQTGREKRTHCAIKFLVHVILILPAFGFVEWDLGQIVPDVWFSI